MTTQESGYDTGVQTDRYDGRTVRGRRTFTETKAGYKTTEFLFAIGAIIAILIATYADEDNLDAADGWRYVAWVAVAYIVSRGLAKLGTREPYTDDDLR